MPYFSIVIPVYQVKLYLRDCVESVLCQTFSDYEIILVDDGSTDGSSAICDEYSFKYPNIKTVHQQNAGLPGARNSGVKISNGQFLLFMDSDDWWNDNFFLEKAYRMLSQNSSDMIVFGMNRYFENEKKFGNQSYTLLSNINELNREDALRWMINNNKFSISAWSRIIKRDFFLENNLFYNEKLKTAEDIEWTFRVMLAQPSIVGMDECPYVYRIRPGSICTTKPQSGWWKNRYTAVRMAFEQITNSALCDEYKNLLYSALAYHYYISLGQIAMEPVKSIRQEAFVLIQKLSVLQNYKADNKTNMARIVVKILGVPIGAKILNFVIRRRYIKANARIRE